MTIAGRELGHFRLTEQIGEGGMGIVFRAQDTRLGRDLAGFDRNGGTLRLSADRRWLYVLDSRDEGDLRMASREPAREAPR